MRELRNILELYDRGHATVLVTLVRVEGSSYRRAGARLLIAGNGEYAGGISGGCLEAEVIRKALWKVRDGAIVDQYSTLFDDTADIPYGLGCGGTVDLLLEPVNTPECAALFEAIRASLQGVTSLVETTLPTINSPLRRSITPSPAHEAPPQQATFTETLTPPQRLILFGAGDDAQPVVRFAALLGWDITVIDSRPQWARPERFPEADQVLTLDASAFVPTARLITAWGEAPRNASKNLKITPNDAIVIMTHSYEQDRAALTAVLPTHPRYLGLLGARHRSALLVSEAASTLGWTTEQACAGLFAPIGLDLGGDGAELIALAVIAEIQACLENKIAIPRRMTAEIIATQLAQGSADRYLQTQCAL